MLSKGYLTDSQFRIAAAQSKSHNEDLEATLLRLGLATERNITAARAAQWGCPVLGQDYTNQSLEADIPPTLLHRCAAVPVNYSSTAKRFVLGFVYRVEHSLLSSLETITGFRAQPCFITPTEFNEQIEKVSPIPGYEEVLFEDAHTPSHMAKAVGGLAVELGANEVGFARCREFVWTRLAGKRGTMDVLFRTKGVAGTERTDDSSLADPSVRSIG
jgi:hypothetical protein